jgi:hypothetical protein
MGGRVIYMHTHVGIKPEPTPTPECSDVSDACLIIDLRQDDFVFGGRFYGFPSHACPRRRQRSDFRRRFVTPVDAEYSGFRVRMVWLHGSGSGEAGTFVAASERLAQIRREHLRFVTRIECDALGFVHESIKAWGASRVMRLGPYPQTAWGWH